MMLSYLFHGFFFFVLDLDFPFIEIVLHEASLVNSFLLLSGFDEGFFQEIFFQFGLSFKHIFG